MERLTKAAIATGGAAVLLLGGAGTMAYWTAQGTATGTALVSGTLEATDGSCTAWEFDESDGGDGTVDGLVGGEPADILIVPGDTVVTACTVTVKGTGDHLKVTADLDSEPSFVETTPLAAALAPEVEVVSVLVGDVDVTTTGVDLSDGAEVDLVVTVTVQFPYGDAPDDTTKGLTATLDDLTITVTQAPHESAAP